MIDLSLFNDAQKQAITDTHPYIKVIAGAGSGKTAVLTNRIAYLVQERNINPYKILAITFTNKAAKEMKNRVEKLLEIDRFEGVISTFHSLGLRILKEDINRLGYDKDFNIIDGDDQKKIIRDLNKKLNYDNDIFKVNSIISYISNKKNRQETFYYEYTSKVYDKFYEAYQAYLKKFNSLDFDDLIVLSVELFKKDQTILEKWRYRFHYIHVDEFQDTNYYQYELVKLLGMDLNVFVVGDPDQTIYTWRGAKIDYILNFEDDFKGAIEIKLEYNYRSFKHILDVANSVIVNNRSRVEKELVAYKEGDDEKVIHYVATSRSAEADFVVDKINETIENNEGANYNDFAILYRSNYNSRVFEQALTRNSIDYRIVGTTRFFERQEIKDLLAYLKLINNRDDLSFLRVINVPKRKIGSKMLDKIITQAEYYHCSFFDVIDKYQDTLNLNKVQKQKIDEFITFIKQDHDFENIGELIDDIARKFDILEGLNEQDIAYQKKLDNINELITYATNYQGELSDFLLDTSLDTNDEEDAKQAVTMMSIHGAKGLEFDYVFVVHMSDGIFPSERSLMENNIEEERRLAYVAFTRARKQLFIVSHSFNDFHDPVSSSMFIKEIGNNMLQREGRFSQDFFIKPKIDEFANMKQRKKSQTTPDDFAVHDIVIHPLYKKGVVIQVETDVLTIAFENNIGIKVIQKGFVEKVDK